MVYRRSKVEHEGEGGAEQRDVVDVALRVVELAELSGEADREEEEPEQNLRPRNERAQLLEQLTVLTLEALLRGLVILSFGHY